ncbi:MAG: DUF881 domain-containing protein [Anaerolineae bacterium]|jgi:uncharacterized protein YlxW (UPF0749 family)
MLRRGLISRLWVAAVLLGLGVATIAQLRSQRNLQKTLYSEDEQVVLLGQLVDANHRLRAEISALSTQQAAYDVEQQGTVLEKLVADLNQVRLLNGAAVVAGPGIELVLDGPLNALDLQDTLNELRNAGAEAIALNGVRLTASSVFDVTSSGELRLGDQEVSRPYRLQAIGDPQTIEAALLRRGGILAVLERSYPALSTQIIQRERLVLDVSRAPATLQYAELVR